MTKERKNPPIERNPAAALPAEVRGPKASYLTHFLLAASIMLVSVSSTCIPSAHAAEAEPAYVQVKATKLRSSARHWAAAKADLNYGDQLSVLEELDQWVRVRTKSGKEGFVPQSALTSQRISLKGSSDSSLVPADESDVALAGKGFSPEVEKQLASSNRSLNYAAVDRMEKVRIADSEVLAFIKAGKLKE